MAELIAQDENRAGHAADTCNEDRRRSIVDVGKHSCHLIALGVKIESPVNIKLSAVRIMKPAAPTAVICIMLRRIIWPFQSVLGQGAFYSSLRKLDNEGPA